MILARARTPGAEHLTWHGLRHTGLTLAASVPGATVRNIVDRGGHSTPRAALIYQHTAASADERIAAGLDALLTRGGGRYAAPPFAHPEPPVRTAGSSTKGDNGLDLSPSEPGVDQPSPSGAAALQISAVPSGRQQREGGDVPGADHGEVSSVQGGDLVEAEAFGHSHD